MDVAPTEVTIGEGNDRHTERKRRPEDTAFVTIKGGGVGTPVPEDLYLAVTQSYAQEPLVDAVINCTLESVYGREIRSRSPWEVLVGWHEAELSKAACKRAGRPGLALGCVENAVSDISELSASSYGGFSPNDWHHVAMISEFKTDYMALSKLTHAVRTGSIIHAFYNTIYGGSCGGKEGMALAIVGGCILLQMLYMTNTHSVSPAHPFYDNDTTPEIMQAISLAQQALARNSRLLTDVVITPVGGPGTKTLLYECAAMAIMATASGACGLIGPRSGAGIHSGHVSGLEARFTAEVARAAAGMSRRDADVLVRKLVALYQPELNQRPVGQSFTEVYDPITGSATPGMAGDIRTGERASSGRWGSRCRDSAHPDAVAGCGFGQRHNRRLAHIHRGGVHHAFLEARRVRRSDCARPVGRCLRRAGRAAAPQRCALPLRLRQRLRLLRLPPLRLLRKTPGRAASPSS